MVKDGKNAQLRPQVPVVVAFYRDGFYVDDPNHPPGDARGHGLMHAFTKYSSKQGQAVVTDFLQGYLPAEFQTLYPEGVQVDIVDHIGQPYAPPPPPSGQAVSDDGPAKAGAPARAMRRRSKAEGAALGPAEEPKAGAPPGPGPGTHAVGLQTEVPHPTPPAGARGSQGPGPSKPAGVRGAEAPLPGAGQPKPVAPARPRGQVEVQVETEASGGARKEDVCRLKVRSYNCTLLLRMYVTDTVQALKVCFWGRTGSCLAAVAQGQDTKGGGGWHKASVKGGGGFGMGQILDVFDLQSISMERSSALFAAHASVTILQ